MHNEWIVTNNSKWPIITKVTEFIAPIYQKTLISLAFIKTVIHWNFLSNCKICMDPFSNPKLILLFPEQLK